MRLYHFGCGMNRIFGSLTVFHTHNYADNYSPEVLKLQFSGPPVIAYVQNIVMPTLQQMHRNTAASPRSTAKLFLLMEELSYRHLYRVGHAWLGNFKLKSPTGHFIKEDDFASSGFMRSMSFILVPTAVAVACGDSHPADSSDLIQQLEKCAQTACKQRRTPQRKLNLQRHTGGNDFAG